MFVKSARFNLLLSLVFVFASGACGGGGLGCGCTTAPLPGGQLPPDQTVEGGAQVRITPSGMATINTLIQTIVTGSLGDGTCIGSGEIGNAGGFLGTGAYYCYQNDNQCTPGCDVDVAVTSFSLTPVGANTLNLRTTFNIDANVPLDYQIIGIGGSCNMTVNANNLLIDANISLNVRASDGELDIRLSSLNNLALNLNFGNCGLVSGLLSLISDVLDFIENYLGSFINGLITPLLNDLIQGFLPDPLGIEGMIDLGAMMSGVSPGTEALMEGRFVPGGYVSLNGGGMTLGVITGVNADEDPISRTTDLDSEPSLCVPPFAPPNFAIAVPPLPRHPTRNTYTLAAAGAFSGAPDPAGDLAMGISETTLDLFGHHLVASGGMCLGVGTNLAAQLNVNTISILVQSLGELASDVGNDPLLLVTRPQRPLDFTIGDGVATPQITIKVSELEVDFYAFLYERYTRVFTLALTMDIGINFTVDNAAVPPTLTPTLTGLTAGDIQIRALNSEFVRETPAQLEAVLPTVFDLALPLLADGLGPIDVPDFSGFALRNIALGKVTTTQDDFLAITATLGPSAMMRTRGAYDPHWGDVVVALDRATADPNPAPISVGSARLGRVHTPAPDAIRAALQGTGGDMPSVTIDVDPIDALGRPLEWSWRLDGGLWRPFTTASPLVIADRAFAWQGKYAIGLRSRVVGDTRTEARFGTELPVIIDSVPPRILEAKVGWVDGNLDVPAWDIVSLRAMEWAFARPGDDQPATAWQPTGSLERSIAESLMEGGELQAFVRDEAGNVAIALVRPFHGAPGEGGCNCDASGGPGAGSLILFAVTGLVLVRRRRSLQGNAGQGNAGLLVGRALRTVTRVAPTVVLWFGLALAASLVPGCSCGSQGTRACETVDDCAGFCSGGDVPFCIDGMCVCSDDIPVGKVGPYSDIAGSSSSEAWVSAYAQSHGDLVVAQVATEGRIPDPLWQWIDGVPDGPVEIPDSMIRGGISAAGPDVGMYSSIAVAPDGSPMVTYFDRETGSLKFAQLVNGVWQNHVVDPGLGGIDQNDGAVVGMYTAVTPRSDDGRPGVAYLAHVNSGGELRAEVRWASAQTPTPTSQADWTFWTVDTAMIPPEDPSQPDIFPLPRGLGLFVDAARGPNQAPVVVYYDRVLGDLKMARFDVTGGTFMAPELLDGASGRDAGWSPTVGIDDQGIVHVAYVAATYDDLLYVRSDAPGTLETIDNGYRIVGTSPDGLPKPEFHFVGDDATMIITPAGPTVVYQDATTHELLLGQRNPNNGQWSHVTIAGAEDPFVGAFGFFASGSKTTFDLVLSTWVIDQPNSDNWVEVFRRPYLIQ